MSIPVLVAYAVPDAGRPTGPAAVLSTAGNNDDAAEIDFEADVRADNRREACEPQNDPTGYDAPLWEIRRLMQQRRY